MPNHVTTKVIVRSNEAADIERFRDQHLVKDGEGNWYLDFDSIVPMPEMLTNTTSPNRGTDEAHAAVEQTGYPNWYEWRVENWGTKWNSYHFSEDPYLVGDKEYHCSFETAWSYPQAIFEKLHELHPTLDMEVMFFCEGLLIAGHGKAHDPTYCEATDELYEEVYGQEPERESEPEDDPELQIDRKPQLEEEPEME